MTRTSLIFATVGAAALSLSVETGSAQAPACGPHDAIVQSLAEQYRENPQSVGMVDSNTLVEIFVSDQGSWTILATDTAGKSCVLSAGEGWETKIAALPGA